MFNKIIPEMLPIGTQSEINTGTSDRVLVSSRTLAQRLIQALANVLSTSDFASLDDTSSTDKVETPAGSQRKINNLATAFYTTLNQEVESLNNDLTYVFTNAIDEVKKSIVPSGVITMWSGSITSIPSGWVLCNGSNSTPDLRDRFVMGAGLTYSVGTTGGSNTHTHTSDGSSVSISGSVGGTALTIDQMPSHTHTTTYNSFPSGAGTGSLTNITSWEIRGTTKLNYTGNNVYKTPNNYTGNSQAHTHTFTGSGTVNVAVTEANHLPKYFALAYIMKS